MWLKRLRVAFRAFLLAWRGEEPVLAAFLAYTNEMQGEYVVVLNDNELRFPNLADAKKQFYNARATGAKPRFKINGVDRTPA